MPAPETAPRPAPVTALGGARFDGLAVVAERPPAGRIALKGDLATLTGPATAVTGAAMPDRLRFEDGERGRIAWMAPDELLLTVPWDALAEAVGRLTDDLSGSFATVVDVSSARAAFGVEGPATRDVLAEATPIDLRDGAFDPGAFRRTRLAQVAAAIAREAPDRAEVLVFRSVAAYAFELLRAAADPAAPVALHGAGRTTP